LQAGLDRTNQIDRVQENRAVAAIEHAGFELKIKRVKLVHLAPLAAACGERSKPKASGEGTIGESSSVESAPQPDKRFRAKWVPVARRKRVTTKNYSLRSDSIEPEKPPCRRSGGFPGDIK
jgi:hypothetical protein